MSIRAAGRLLSRAVIVGGAGVAAATTGYLGFSKADIPPSQLPDLSDSAPPRKEQLAALSSSSPSRPFDILVIGGGATGTGVALDAATRGLSVALVERDDFASGTSSKSTKLVHGGVRYLEKAFLQQDTSQLSLVFHALAERATLLHNAPHLTWPLPTLTPCYSWWELPYYWAGLKAYDLLAGRQVLHSSRSVSPEEASAMIPTLAKKTRDGRTLKGGVVYFDGQMDDARVNVALATTAARAGAVVANHASVTSLHMDAMTGRVEGATIRDELTGRKMDVHARVVVNATGVFCDSIRRLADPSLPPSVIASSGAHVVLPEFYLGAAGGSGGVGALPAGGAAVSTGGGSGGGSVGLLIPRTRDGRVLFMLPWLGRTVAGTTDDAAKIEDEPVPKEEEVKFVIETLKEYLDIDVRQSDILSVWSGLRPLLLGASAPSKQLPNAAVTQEVGGQSTGAIVKPDPQKNGEREAEGESRSASEQSTSGVVREHVVMVDANGLVTITGGKWTTYRSMAEQTVDTAIRAGGLAAGNAAQSNKSNSHVSSGAGHQPSACVTKYIPLTGGEGYSRLLFPQLMQNSEVLRRGVGADKRVVPGRLDSAVVAHLVRSYGIRAIDVKNIAADEVLGERLVAGYPDLEAEVAYAARNEFCETAADFLCRRSRLAFLDADAALQALPRVVQLLAKEHGWSGRRQREELAEGRRVVERFSAKV